MQLNSEYFSKACDWNFPVEGDPSVNGAAGINLGLQLNPGDTVWSSGFNILTPLVTTGNPAVDTVTIFFIINLGATFRIITDTVDNLNLLLPNTWYYNGSNASYAAGAVMMQNPFAIGTAGVYQIKASSTAPMTAGRIMVNLNCTTHYIH